MKQKDLEQISLGKLSANKATKAYSLVFLGSFRGQDPLQGPSHNSGKSYWHFKGAIPKRAKDTLT